MCARITQHCQAYGFVQQRSFCLVKKGDVLLIISAFKSMGFFLFGFGLLLNDQTVGQVNLMGHGPCRNPWSVPLPRQTAAVIGLNSSGVMFLHYHRSNFVMDLF